MPAPSVPTPEAAVAALLIVRLNHYHYHGVTIPRIPRAGGHTGAYVRSICLCEEGSKPGSYSKQPDAHICRLLPHMDDYISGADEPANGSGVCKWRRTRSIVARPERMSLGCILVVPICFSIPVSHLYHSLSNGTTLGHCYWSAVFVRPEHHA
ncbi:hypothetical protein NMY22_g1863 [Coprinellus aureogranulatus]|nr:hypothetical protein NMY22_g1863 [Coprinellus aureogranulatus]